MQAYSNLSLRDFNGSAAALGALVELSDQSGVIQHRFLIGPGGAGMSVSDAGKTYKVITPSSPLGQQLIGKEEGDEIKWVINSATVTYEVGSVC
jgi:transcription elongation GreA/GreB family factor